ncbi:hypothetical protein [Fervidicella metallireducens]|uniref:hypothetical protein n=1 Tax=Fervidicella metallireducens TaxID=655338 RepID=UPI000AC81A78|nr:hypothetical protein [Fervidicella metallireducens]
MQLYIVILLGLIIILFLLKGFNLKPHNIEINDVLLSYEELLKHAKETAKSHRICKNKNGYNYLFDRLDENFDYITDVYKKLNAYSKGQLPLCPASEWLLDNYYIIEEQYKRLKQNKEKKFFKNLNVLKDGYLKDYPRIFAIALELAVHTDGKIDEDLLINFVRAYQSINTLSMAELWALSPAIKIALFEKIRYTCEKIYNTQLQWKKAEKIKYTDEDSVLNVINQTITSSNILLPSFIERVVNIAKYRGINLNPIMDYLEEYLLKFDTCLEDIIKHEHQEQASMQIAMGNSITSLRVNASIDWEEVFESLSIVEGILEQDPSNIYSQQDFETRDYYRHRVEKIAKLLNISESSVARAAVECSEKGLPDCTASYHVGYYLSGKGINILLNKLGAKKLFLRDKYDTPYIYILPFAAMTIVFSSLVSYASFLYTRNYTISLVIFILSITPLSDVALSLTNWIVTHTVKPDFIPKLEMKYGIPENKTTMVIVPTILPDVSRVKELISQLEVTYLANKENNIYFALVGDFKDYKEETSPNDQQIVDTALYEISKLNKKYSRNIFFFLLQKKNIQ